MKEIEYVGKVVYTKTGKRLGYVRRIEGKSGAKVLSEQPHIVVQVDRFLAKPDFILIHIDKIKRIKGKDIFLTITQEEFKKLQKVYRTERARRLADDTQRQKAKKDYDKGVTRTLVNQKRHW
ncbi:MAG: hypothetical protein GF308_19640 [Candidatus Heimdallarchaeota archaeon]|nr:hypothetical protein [Candidatus Heimdallarchaeota archaeon]